MYNWLSGMLGGRGEGNLTTKLSIIQSSRMYVFLKLKISVTAEPTRLCLLDNILTGPVMILYYFQ